MRYYSRNKRKYNFKLIAVLIAFIGLVGAMVYLSQDIPAVKSEVVKEVNINISGE